MQNKKIKNDCQSKVIEKQRMHNRFSPSPFFISLLLFRLQSFIYLFIFFCFEIPNCDKKGVKLFSYLISLNYIIIIMLFGRTALKCKLKKHKITFNYILYFMYIFSFSAFSNWIFEFQVKLLSKTMISLYTL